MKKFRYQHRLGSMQLVIIAYDMSTAEDKLKEQFKSTWGDWIFMEVCEYTQKLGL